MTKLIDNNTDALQFAELGAAPTTPATGKWRVYTKSTGLFVVDDAGAETGPFGVGGSVATDAIWDAAGDLVQGTGANTGAKLSAGTAGNFLRSAGAAAANTWAFPPGHEFDYVEKTSDTSITATSAATANTIVTGNAVTYDGSTPVIIEFFTPAINTEPTGGSLCFVVLYDGTGIGTLAIQRTPASANDDKAAYVRRRLTPSAASHTYSIRAYVSAGTSNVSAGAGGVGVTMPAFIRITKAN